MIIDFRSRPPYGEFKNSYIMSDVDFMTQFAARFNMPVAESVKNNLWSFTLRKWMKLKLILVLFQGENVLA